MKKLLLVFIFLFSLTLVAREPEEYLPSQQNNEQRYRVSNSDITFELPRFIFDYTNTRVTVKFLNPKQQALILNNNQLSFIVNGQPQLIKFDINGIGYFYYTFKNKHNLKILFEDVNFMAQASVISIWYIISPLAALLMFLTYTIVSTSMRKNANLTIAHNSNPEDNTNQEVFASTLRVVQVKEKEDVF